MILLIRGLYIEGNNQGIDNYAIPKWDKLLDPGVSEKLQVAVVVYLFETLINISYLSVVVLGSKLARSTCGKAG